jgi:methylmalonyl-CoA mutase
MKKTLDFNEFSSSTLDIWKKGVLKELGGKAYESLIWSFDDQLSIDPYFSRTNQKLNVVTKSSSEWAIKESFVYNDPKSLNKSILESLEGGVNALEILINESADVDFNMLFNDVFTQYIQVFFSGEFATHKTVNDFFEYSISKGVDVSLLTGGLLSSADQLEISNRIKLLKTTKSSFAFFNIDAVKIQKQGGNASHSIVYALVQGTSILNTLIEHGIDPSTAANSIRFSFATEPSYFIEIGKLRAFRTLWAQVLKAFDPEIDVVNSIRIDSKTSSFYQSSVDRHNNMLRATTQSMSAIIGGTDTLEVLGFETSLGLSTSESRRWARNIQHLLIEESYFSHLHDASNGSYYIEEITYKLAEHAWKRFQYWQAKNESLDNSEEWDSHLTNCISEMKKTIENGSKVFLGVNKYPNKTEKISLNNASKDRLVADFEVKIGEEKQ